MSARGQGRFITLEGGEGTGKSTQAKRLADALSSRGIVCVSTREPGGSPGAEQIRNLLVRGEANRWDPLTETMLMFAARADHVAHTIKPALRERRWVISDRFTDSTYAYQGAGRGIPRETIRRVEAIALGDFRPDLTLILDLPVEEGLARARDRGSQEDRFEHFDRAFHERLRAAFLAIAKRAPDRCRLIDASGSEDEVADAILSAVRKQFRIR
jgi:dTMP kinase